VVVLVGLHVRLDVLRGHQANLRPSSRRPTREEVRASTGLHADQSDADVRSEAQQLQARKLPVCYYLTSPVQTNQVKYRLPRSMPIVSS
jgi:hypothetical protein